MTLKEMVDALLARKARALEMGGPDKVKRQHDRGKLTARERIDLLLDPGSFEEFGILAKQPGTKPEESPADGLITGYGQIDGRPVGVAAYDFTVYGGSMGRVGETKTSRLRDMVLRGRMPIIWLVDSGGARIQAEAGGYAGSGSRGDESEDYGASMFADTGYLFREQCVMSGVIPQVAAMVGPGAAGTAYIPGLADFVPMVKGRSSMALGGPYLVKAAVGEDVTEEDLGGSKVHCEVSGCADLEVPDDAACMESVRKYLSFFPSHCEQAPPVIPCTDPADRREEGLLSLVPDNPRRAYDMLKVVKAIVDNGDVFEIKPRYARNIITALARLDGIPVGVLANNPMHLGGMLDINASDKAARFVNLCDAFGIPLVFLQDVPGYVVGSKAEQAGIIRHGAKMIHRVSNATVPKLTVVIRKAYGAGYYGMAGRAYEPDYLAAWPLAEISVMGAEGMVSIFGRKMMEAAGEGAAELKQQLVERINKGITPYIPAQLGMIDDVIDPRDTRRALIRALHRSKGKRVERPWRKLSIVPV
jgi:acetyl-CoA carboxylase carboxyltransferase component